MKLFLLFSLLCIHTAPLPPDTTKPRAAKKQMAAAKPAAKLQRATGPLLPSVLIVDIY